MYFESVDVRPFSTRKQIFSEYKLPDDPIKIEQRMEISKDKKSSNQVLLKQLGLFKFNLSSVLFEKNDLLKKLSMFDQSIRRVYNFIAEYNEGDFADSEQIERKFKGIQDVRRQSEIIQNVRSSIRKSKVEAQKFEQSQYLMRALIIYKGLLNYGDSLKFDGQSFRLGTLSNYNPKYTQVKFTKVPQQSENAVMRYISKIIEQSSKAMEAKVRYQNNYEKDRFLLQEDKYNNCWKSLQELYSSKQVQLINFEMLNILNAFDEEFQRFKGILRSHNDNCKKYQGVMDSMDLMGRQTQQMVHTIQSRDQIISTLVNLSEQDPQQMQRVLIKCSQQQKLIEKNIKIYHINQRLFASYNTETNLKSYSRLRNNYSIRLNELENRLSKWNGEYDSMREIVQSYNTVDDIINKKIADHKRIGFTKNSADVDRMILRIEEVNTRKNKQIVLLKNNVLLNLQQKIKNPNEKDSTSSARKVSLQNDQFLDDEILEKQRSFFLNLQRIPEPEKKPFLLQNHEKIKEYIEYNRRKSEDNKISSSLRERLKIFEGRFSLLSEITKICKQLIQKETAQQHDDESDSFDSIIKDHLKTILKQLSANSNQSKRLVDQVVYQHIYDFSLFQICFESQNWFQLTRTLQKVQGSFISRPVSFTSNNSVKALKQLISFTKEFVKEKYPQLTIKMLEIFSQTLFELANGVSTQLYNFEDFYWRKMTQTISIFYERNNYKFEQNAYNSKTIDKSSFFSLPYLIHLNRTSNRYKVLNLDEILTKIVKMMYDQFMNLREYQVFENAICLTYLMKYIKNVCSRDEIQQKIFILSKLRRLLTSHLLKSQFMRIYEMEQKSQKQISNKMIEIILGLQGYLTFTDVMIQKKEKITQFESENNKYLKGIQQEIKPLVINLSAYSNDLTLQKIKLLWGFQELPFNLNNALSYPQSLSSSVILSYISIQRQNLQSLLKLVEFIEWSSIKESDGFLIRMIRKENLYLKRQLNKFKALQKENVWKQFDQLLQNLISQLESQNSLRKATKEEAQRQINSIELKIRKTLANLDQRYR